MRVRARLAAAAIGFLVPALALARWTASPASASGEVVVPALPKPVGTWDQAGEAELTDVELAMIRPDAYVLRGYEAPDRSPILLYVGLYRGRAGYDVGAHDPEVCFPAQGWQITGSRDIEIALANRETLYAKLLDTHKGTNRQMVLYWFQPAVRWPAGAMTEQLLRIFDAIAGHPQYAFVRLSTPNWTSGAEPERDLADFASQIAGPVRDALGGMLAGNGAGEDRRAHAGEVENGMPEGLGYFPEEAKSGRSGGSGGPVGGRILEARPPTAPAAGPSGRRVPLRTSGGRSGWSQFVQLSEPCRS